MKTYNVNRPDAIETAPGSHGAFIKTTDYFEAVAEYDAEIVALRRERDALLLRFEAALAGITTLVERARKGVTS